MKKKNQFKVTGHERSSTARECVTQCREELIKEPISESLTSAEKQALIEASDALLGMSDKELEEIVSQAKTILEIQDILRPFTGNTKT